MNRNKKLFLVLVGIISLLLILSGCSKKTTQTALPTAQKQEPQKEEPQKKEPQKQEPIVLKIADVTSSKDTAGVTLVEFAKSVEEETNGRVQIKVFSDGVLGSEKDTLDQVHQGALAMQLAHGVAILDVLDKRFAIDELPFAFATREKAYAALDGDVGQIINKMAEDYGFKFLAYWENGYRNFTNSSRPIYKPEDLKGLKFRVAETELRLQTFKALGANAIPMAFPELYTALQQKTVDGQENPLSIIYNSKFYEVQKYLSLSGHLWGGAPMIINLKTWNSLPPDIQDVIQRNAIKYRDIQRKRVQDDDQQLVQKLKESGMEVNEVDKEAFMAAVQPVWDNARARFGDELIDAIEKYRK